MLTTPLPTTLDARKAAARGTDVKGVLRPVDLPRFRPLLADDEGLIEVELSFSQDDEKRHLVGATIVADVQVTCQRCLESMPKHLACSAALAIVWSDEEAAHLPKHLDPLIVEDQNCSLWELVEDELILSLSPFNYHEDEGCKEKVREFSDPRLPTQPQESKPNPFNMLAQLRSGEKHQE